MNSYVVHPQTDGECGLQSVFHELIRELQMIANRTLLLLCTFLLAYVTAVYSEVDMEKFSEELDRPGKILISLPFFKKFLTLFNLSLLQ